jgi:hypothetical protein
MALTCRRGGGTSPRISAHASRTFHSSRTAVAGGDGHDRCGRATCHGCARRPRVPGLGVCRGKTSHDWRVNVFQLVMVSDGRASQWAGSRSSGRSFARRHHFGPSATRRRARRCGHPARAWWRRLRSAYQDMRLCAHGHDPRHPHRRLRWPGGYDRAYPHGARPKSFAAARSLSARALRGWDLSPGFWYSMTLTLM